MREWITGRNPVFEVLHARRRQVFRLWVSEGAQERGRLSEILRLASDRKLPVERLPRGRLDGLASGHQGVALEASGYPYVTLADIQERAVALGEPLFLLVLDTLQDPQNLGTLLRTGEATGVHGVLLPLRRTVTVTPAVVHASSGASEHLLIAQGNLAQLIGILKGTGTWVIGLEDHPKAVLPGEVRLDGPLALVVGSEGEGMRPLVRKSCDLLLCLPMRGQIDSFNAAVAGSIALFLAWQAKGYPGQKQKL